MIWTGQELYAQYCQRMEELTLTGNDEWDQLPKGDQDVWNALAVDVTTD